MPVRIYEIAKKLGIQSKEVLAKAKELEITGARVASSSIDKITAEYLEQKLVDSNPALKPEAAPEPEAETAPATPEPIIIVKAPEKDGTGEAARSDVAPSLTEASEPERPEKTPFQVVVIEPPTPKPPEPAPAAETPPATAAVEAQTPTAPAPAEPVVEDEASAPVRESEAEEGAEDQPVKEPEAEPTPKTEPAPEPETPKLGQKIGSIALPAAPVRRPAQKAARAEQQASHGTRTRGEQHGRRGMTDRREARQARGKTSAPAQPRFVPPTTGEVIRLRPPVVIRDLAERMNQKPFRVIAALMEIGVLATVNQAIDELNAQKICAKFGYRFELEKRDRSAKTALLPKKEIELDFEDKPEDLVPRPPVVTIMGHVDHGKTTLLDVIRKSNVVSGEAGGITQHIGAYTISFPHPDDKKRLQQITFLDTPGHAAFSSMRARGATVTDLIVLVVAANDGVMPQTIEALDHAKASGVPILVAVNKIDMPGANPMKPRQQLQERGLAPDDWGGDTIFVDCSAVTKEGVDKLLEMILLQADLLELKANPKRRAAGNVIESGLEPGGPTATVLVRKGTLHLGDAIICGPFYGRTRALISEDGKRLKEAGPSHAVKVLGLNGVPEAGIEFVVVENEKAARELGEKRSEQAKAEELEARAKVTLENLFDTLAAQESKVLKVIVKADTQGSAEAIVSELGKIESEKVSVEVIRHAVGTVTESDVLLAAASQAVILGFHTRIDTGVAEKAKHHGVQIKLYSIIYELVDEIKLAMAGLLDPISKDVVTGSAEVRKVFDLSKGAPVAGCMVTSGRIMRGKVRVRRGKNVIFEGNTQSLRRFQDEVNEVRSGMECGIRLDGFAQYEIGDTIECYTVEKVAQSL